MPLNPLSTSAFAFIEQADAFYAALTHRKPHLGGHLLYAAELTEAARPAIVAANIAGAATLSVSADLPFAKQAMRDGIVDFLVNSLDEALRILKNEIRKREAVAVCVTAAPQAIEQEMRDRGVRPDLTLSGTEIELTSQAGAITLSHIAASAEERVWLTWRPAQSAALWLPKLDALALAGLPPEAATTRRWLERAPRYLGRITRNLRVLHLTQQQADQLIAAFSHQLPIGTVSATIEITLGPWTSPTTKTLQSLPDP